MSSISETAPSFCQENDRLLDLYCLEVSKSLKTFKDILSLQFFEYNLMVQITAKAEMITLPETNSLQNDSNWWLTILSFWDGLFSGTLAVSFGEFSTIICCLPSHILA